MLALHLRRYAVVTAAIAVLAGCGESQPQSGSPLPTRDGAYSKARGMQWNFTVRVVPKYETATIVAYCTGNAIVTGGGWNVDSVNSGHPYVWQDHPGTKFDSWSVTIENDSATKATVRVYAGCLPSTDSR